MNAKSDVQLLREYAAHGHEAAFTEIVRRHLDLVYSAALRQVELPAAADIAQSVFVDLARKAASVSEKFPADAALTGWLHRSTRYAALNHLRDTRRHLTNERQAMEQLITNSESDADWEQIRPVLDEALDNLADEDREVLLLRYFENKNLREVGEQLKISDAAAQKRVSRAVEKLREFFSKRKITIGASGLTILISANAVQSAPIGLAATISAAAVFTGTTISTSTAIATTKVIAMTTIQKSIIGATLAIVAGAGIFEAHQNSKLQNQIQALQQQQTPLNEQIQQLQSALNEATNQLAALLAENAQLKSNSNENELLKLRGEVTQLRTANLQKETDPTESAAKVLVATVNQLKQRLEQMPWQKIPELQFLTTQDWLREASLVGDLNTDDDFDRALAELRSSAKQRFAYSMGAALDDYIAANNGQLPNDISDLKSYFNPPVDDAMLQRYQLLQTGNLNDLSTSDSLIKEKSPVNDQHDTLITIGAFGYHYEGVGAWGGSGTGGFGTNITAKIKPFAKQ
ncbi:MAG TPA: sigma-70 family RNA polymerase sigma factor [Verrucomicrobiae bacterium]|nr:sigma-70 family RNA polymerase sigma factor [Verrucomicrobiae bacterium]